MKVSMIMPVYNRDGYVKEADPAPQPKTWKEGTF